jgi:hypothetical protein
MRNLTLKFVRERTTKNTFRFAEQSANPVVGTLYVKKWAHSSLGAPENLTVTIAAASVTHGSKFKSETSSTTTSNSSER